jgi:hypothetical protein
MIRAAAPSSIVMPAKAGSHGFPAKQRATNVLGADSASGQSRRYETTPPWA